jgi:hydrogenase maturation protease
MRPLIVGIGNRWRGDDGVGPVAVERLARLPDVVDHVDLLELDGESSRLLDAWTGRPRTIVVDAVRMGDEPGTIHRVEVGHDPLPLATDPSTHAAGLAHAVALGRSLDRMPGHLLVVGVEPASVADGEGLSPQVAAALDELVALVRTEVRAHVSG